MGKFFFYLILFAIGPLLLRADGAQLKTDYSLRSETIVEAYIATDSRRCSSKFGIFHHCNFAYSADGERQDFDYNFFAFGAPDIVRIQKGANSGQLTTTVGQDYFWHRAVTVGLGLLLSGFMVLALLSPIFLGRDEDEDFGSTIPRDWHGGSPNVGRAGHGPAPASPQAYAPRTGFGQAKPQGFGRRTQ